MTSITEATPTTNRQREIHRYMLEYQDAHRMPPTVREIGVALGIRSPNGVMCHIKSLELRGMVKRTKCISRGNLAVRVDGKTNPHGCCPACGRPLRNDDRSTQGGDQGDGQGTVD